MTREKTVEWIVRVATLALSAGIAIGAARAETKLSLQTLREDIKRVEIKVDATAERLQQLICYGNANPACR